MKLLPATALDLPALVELFNAGFSEYLVPMTLDERGMRDYVETNGVDLGCSRVLVEDHGVAFTLIARRGSAGWVAGMGTVPSQRGRGLGERVLRAGIEAARERGCHTVSLEVIDRNRPAVRLYRKLGFEPVRDLLVWSFEPTGGASPGARPVEPDVAHAWIVRNRRSAEPWQRADEVVDCRHQRAPHAHLGDDHGGQYRPERQRQLQSLGEQERREGGNRHPDRERQLHPVSAQKSANAGPHACDALHAESPNATRTIDLRR